MDNTEKLCQGISELTQLINGVLDRVIALEEEIKELQEIIRRN